MGTVARRVRRSCLLPATSGRMAGDGGWGELDVVAGRSKTQDERLDRSWSGLLQELRVAAGSPATSSLP